MAPTKVILLSCGSYNPPTNMHLRMFEIARDHLHKMGSHVVVGGVISPVHDAYGKKDLASSTHRCAMLRLALQNNDWIRLSEWETKREGWTKTRVALQHHQNLLNSWIFDTNDIKHHSEIEDLDWIPDKLKNSTSLDQTPIQVKLLCGADLLESFGTPGLWAEEDIDAIVGQHGLVVVTREESNPNQFIYDSDLLSKYMHNILIVTEWITNKISSTKIRRALRRGESVRYLLQDSVLDYIYTHELYNARQSPGIKLGLSPNNTINNYLNVDSKYENTFLTPSPSDITMDTPSPVEIISIDIPDSVILKKNLLNSSAFASSTKLPINKVDDNDLVREKFFGVMSENGNKLLNSMKSIYPGQAKQIIATETGESHILDEVGCIIDRNNPLSVKNDCNNLSLNSVDNDHSIINSDCKNLTLLEDKNNLLEITCNNVKMSSIDMSENNQSDNCANVKLDDVTDSYQFMENSSSVDNCSETKEGSSIQECKEHEVTDAKTDILKAACIVENIERIDEELAENYGDVCNTIANETNHDEMIDNCTVNKDALEIDGKYLKSLVHSRKSPKKCKNKNEKIPCKEESLINISETAVHQLPLTDTYRINDLGDRKKSANKIKEDGCTQCDKIDSVNSASQTDLTFEIEEENAGLDKKKLINTTRDLPIKASEHNQLFVIQGSLDSVKFNIPNEKSTIAGLDSASKKSKSFESIKYDSSRSISYKSFEISYSDTLKPKSDSTSQLITANFCAECCYADASFMPEASLNQETFYTVQSNQSSPAEEDSTECDICSACNLDSTEVIDTKSSGLTNKCDLCEICNDINADFEGDLVMPYAEGETERKASYILAPSDNSEITLLPEMKTNLISQDVIDNDQFEIKNCGLEGEGNIINYQEVGHFQDDNTQATEVLGTDVFGDSFDSQINSELDNDDFEIENCGLDNNVRSVVRSSSKLNLQLVKNSQLDRSKNDFSTNDIKRAKDCHRNSNMIYSLNDNVKHAKLSLSKYVPNASKRERKIVRKGSFILSDSNGKYFQDKRRYSSVDNLQHSRQIIKLSERDLQKSKGNKLIASADNIQSNNGGSVKLKKLQKSVNDIDSLTENFTDLSENYTVSENNLAPDNKGLNIRANIKIRDSDMVKMILTKHGIKIISEKETAL